MKKMIALVALLMLGGCTDEHNSRKTLRSSGYFDIEITGYSWFECGDNDTFHTGFRAKNPRGEAVEGTVCCGFLAKGCTVRF